MEVLTRTNGREMTLAISGDLDHHGAHGAMQQIDHALDAALPLSLTMDLSGCLLYTSPSPRDVEESRMPSSA